MQDVSKQCFRRLLARRCLLVMQVAAARTPCMLDGALLTFQPRCVLVVRRALQCFGSCVQQLFSRLFRLARWVVRYRTA